MFIVGKIDIDYIVSKAPYTGEMELQLTQVDRGGSFQPAECAARQKVALIVPFRDREDHLRIFLYHMHSVLQRQQLHYRVFVIEQVLFHCRICYQCID